MSEWISVDDRLPEGEQDVLLYTESPYGADRIFIGYRWQGKRCDETSVVPIWIARSPISPVECVIGKQGNPYMEPRKVTHWMPIPLPN